MALCITLALLGMCQKHRNAPEDVGTEAVTNNKIHRRVFINMASSIKYNMSEKRNLDEGLKNNNTLVHPPEYFTTRGVYRIIIQYLL